jgi:CubicO group peptidase (beta-lactamase class C family)
MKKFLLLVINLTIAVSIFAQGLPKAKPEDVGMSSKKLNQIDKTAQQAIDEKKTPCVAVLVAKDGKVVYKKAFGYASIEPEKKLLTDDMIFDLASVSKPVGTGTAVMMLVEEGKISLYDDVKEYIPNFAPYINQDGRKEHAKIYHLLTHTSGLPDYTDADSVIVKYGSVAGDSLMNHIAQLKKKNSPGTKFEYSCLGFITLANIVKVVTGKPLNEFAQENIFAALKLKNIGYVPSAEMIKKCVPTEKTDGVMLCGVVHDPLARLQKGISGNAGLFSNLDDLSVMVQLMLNGGEYNGIRLLSPLTVKLMTEVYARLQKFGRGLSWDVASDYMGQRGDIFPIGSYGHTGFTGTSVIIDPVSKTQLIILTNRVHPDGKGDVSKLRKNIANITASAILK